MKMDEAFTRGDIVRNNHAGEGNPIRHLLYIGKGTIRQGRYTHKSYDFIGYDGKKVQIFREDADIEKVGHMDEFDLFLSVLKSLKDFRVESEFEFDPISSKRIANVINKYPMSLAHCAEILESVAPLCAQFTAGGFIQKLKTLLRGEVRTEDWLSPPIPPEKLVRLGPEDMLTAERIAQRVDEYIENRIKQIIEQTDS